MYTSITITDKLNIDTSQLIIKAYSVQAGEHRNTDSPIGIDSDIIDIQFRALVYSLSIDH